ncbi:PEP-CTERM sorting domain-containing protein [Glaciecola sp. 1036]|uniref:PEP-CTERM sorting domain-containing protein n=1 Tax=Alteromonadaceae TaxID=72275 RepID=UPI003D05BEF0
MFQSNIKTIFLSSVAIVLLAVSTISYATPILVGTSDRALGIENLQIGDDLFDVSFTNFGRFNDRVTQPMAFVGNESMALEAATIMANFLTDNTVTGLTNVSNNFNTIFVMVPFEFTADEFTTHRARSFAPHDGTWSTTATPLTLSRTGNFGNLAFANFTQLNPVNAPSSLALIALVTMGFFLRRKKA